MKITNKLNLPQSLVNAVTRDDYTPGSSDVTVTEIVKPIKAAVLSRLHYDEIERDVSDAIFALMGRAIHHVLEVSDTELTEERLYYMFPETKALLGGKFDRFVLKDNTLQDYKVASVWSRIFDSLDDWQRQLNAYAFLAEENGKQVDKLEIVCIYRDWSATMAERNKSSGYPQTQVEIINVNKLPNDIEFNYLNDQVKTFMIGMDNPGALPDCTDDEMWAQPTKYALKKEGRKSAIKVFDQEWELINYAIEKGWLDPDAPMGSPMPKPYYIEVRPGKRNRCEKYCDASPWCQQYQEYLIQQQGE